MFSDILREEAKKRRLLENKNYEEGKAILSKLGNQLRKESGKMEVLALRSLSVSQLPLPTARRTPASGKPFPSIAVTKRTPPVARAANSLGVLDLKTKLLESANRNTPGCSALTCAWSPAAKL